MDKPAGLRPFADVSDLAAIAEVARGNREMFEVIVRRYNELLFRVGMSYLRNHAQVEDAMQNAYVKAFLHLNRFEQGASFSTWLTRIMINECLMMLRRQRTRPETPLDGLAATATHPNPEPHEEHPAARQLNLIEMKALLESAVAALPRKYRTVYILREVQQLSTAEAAAALGATEASIKVDLHRARERLKSELMKTAAGAELFAYPAVYCNGMTNRVMAVVSSL